jgi:hypothetical protein
MKPADDSICPRNSQWDTPDSPNLSPKDLIASEAKRFTKRWDTLKIEFDGDQIEHSNFPAAYQGASYPLGPNSRGGQLALVGTQFGVPKGLQIANAPNAVPRNLTLASGQIIRSGDDTTVIGAWQEYGLFDVDTCAFRDLWPREVFAKLSGADSDEPIA